MGNITRNVSVNLNTKYFTTERQKMFFLCLSWYLAEKINEWNFLFPLTVIFKGKNTFIQNVHVMVLLLIHKRKKSIHD